METSSHEVHETSSRRDDRHHFAELQQVAAACDDEVALEAVRLHPEQLLEVTGRKREGIRFRESTAGFECSLNKCLSGRQTYGTKGTHPGKVEPRVPSIPNLLDTQPDRDVILSEQSDGALLRQRRTSKTRVRQSARTTRMLKERTPTSAAPPSNSGTAARARGSRQRSPHRAPSRAGAPPTHR